MSPRSITEELLNGAREIMFRPAPEDAPPGFREAFGLLPRERFVEIRDELKKVEPRIRSLVKRSKYFT